MAFLPISQADMAVRGWDAPDFVLVTGDAYVDHPTFGTAIISRLLEHEGFHVAILAQPDWHTDRDFMRFGRPKLGFLVNAGNLDSMVAHYTAARKRRSDDAYSPGRKAGRRPDRAVTVYTRKLKQLYPDLPVVIGGLEASLRRFAHYDYWDDSIHPSVLIESGADLLIFGMGEHQIVEIAQRMAAGELPAAMRDIRGTCYAVATTDYIPGAAVECPSLEQVRASKREYAISCRKQQDEQDPHKSGSSRRIDRTSAGRPEQYPQSIEDHCPGGTKEIDNRQRQQCPSGKIGRRIPAHIVGLQSYSQRNAQYEDMSDSDHFTAPGSLVTAEHPGTNGDL